MFELKLAHILNKIVDPAGRGSAALGVVAVGLIMLIIVIDVTLRAVVSGGIKGNIDIVGLSLIIVFFSGYAYAEIKKQHIQVDVLVTRFSPTVQQIITTNSSLVVVVMVSLISWQAFRHTGFLIKHHLVSGLLHIPQWPFLAMTAFFLVLFALALLVTFLNHLAELRITIRSVKAYVWLLPGVIVGLGLLAVSLGGLSLLQFEISKGLWGGIIIGLLFVLIFLRVHIAVAMAAAALLGVSYLSGAEAGLTNLTLSAVAVASKYTWSVAPLFMWMGLLVYHAGFAKELYETAYKWIGHLWGGLASATTAACAGLAAVTGSTLTGVLTMGTIALPEMRKYKYNMKLATATIVTASTIGSLIPPSIILIIYGMLTEVSIGKLFIAGIIPGILFTAILVTMITIRCYLNPTLGPPGPAVPWKEKIVSLKNVWAVVLLVIFCVGGLYAGFFTPTEAGAVGAFGAFTIGFARRRLTPKGFIKSAIEAVELTGVMMFIFVFAVAYTHFLAITNLPYDLARWIVGLGLSKYAVISVILFIYIILGCLMNTAPAVILTLPIFFPIAMAAGFDPIWLGVMIAVMADLGQITPPIGMNVFAMSAIARDIPMYDIFKGALPFWGAFMILIVILVLFPQIALFLPNMMW